LENIKQNFFSITLDASMVILFIVIWAKLKAGEDYDDYQKQQDREYISDFDREVKFIQGKQLE
jgi:hypothetical protein